MLILTRKTNESIVISENIRITVLGIQNGIVRLGLTAPNDIKIFREELLTRQPNQKRQDEAVPASTDEHRDTSSKPAINFKR